MSDADEVQLLTRAIARRWLLVLAVTLAGAFIAYWASEQIDPEYEASTSILVGRSREASEADDESVPGERLERLSRTLADIARREPVLEQTVSELGLDVPWEELRRRVSVDLITDTQVLVVSVKDSSPEQAERITDALAQRLIVYSGYVSSLEHVVIEEAHADPDPTSPDVRLNTIIGGGVGFLLASGVALARERRHRRPVAGPGATLLAAPDLGLVTHRDELVPLDDPLSTEAEAYGRALANLHVVQGERPSRVVLVTGQAVGLRHSIAAANFAVMHAQADARTILVDASLRSPIQHRIFGTGREVPGLAEYLTDARTPLVDFLQETTIEGLHLLAAGTPTLNPSVLLAPPRLDRLLDDLRELADVIVIDSPLDGHNAETVLLSREAEAVVLVVGRSRRTGLDERTVTELERAAFHVSGILAVKLPWRVAVAKALRTAVRLPGRGRSARQAWRPRVVPGNPRPAPSGASPRPRREAREDADVLPPSGGTDTVGAGRREAGRASPPSHHPGPRRSLHPPLDGSTAVGAAVVDEREQEWLPVRVEATGTGNGASGPARVDPSERPLALVVDLCRTLDQEGIRYCHWKSNEAIDLSARGENDLDLLIDRADAQGFCAVLHDLGFKEARPPASRVVPGIIDHFGYDTESGRLVHLQAHYQLVLGDDMTKNFRLPIERDYLASASVPSASPFPLPAPELELAVFVLRMVLKHASWDAQLSLQGRLSPSERQELTYLLERVPRDRLTATVSEHLPFLPPELFERCFRAIQAGCPPWTRASTARSLERSLAAHARRPRTADLPLRVVRRGLRGADRHLLGRRAGKRLCAGGLLIAVVGGDGSGKSTVVEHLASWLGKDFAVERFHLGKPRRSPLSMVLRNTMRAARLVGVFTSTRLPVGEPHADATNHASFPGHAWLVWHTINARDRRRTYARARRHATNGGIAICDRFPLPQLTLMDGSRTAPIAGAARMGAVARSLVQLERRWYREIPYPDLLIVLRVDPEIAVGRRPDQDEGYVRARAAEVHATDWSSTPFLVIDGDRAPEEVLTEVKERVWSRL